MTRCTRPNRVTQPLIGCPDSHIPPVFTKIKRFLLQNFRILSTDEQTRCVLPQPPFVAFQCDVSLKKHVGPFHRSLFYWAACFPRVSASLMQHLLSHKFRGLRCEVLNLPLTSVTISPAGPGILSLAYPAADAHFTLVWLDETSGLALANIWEVYM